MLLGTGTWTLCWGGLWEDLHESRGSNIRAYFYHLIRTFAQCGAVSHFKTWYVRLLQTGQHNWGLLFWNRAILLIYSFGKTEWNNLDWSGTLSLNSSFLFFSPCFLETTDLLKSKCFVKWVGFGKLTKPMQSSEETLPARKSAAIRKLLGFLTAFLAHCKGAQFQYNFMYRLSFLKMQSSTSTSMGDLSFQFRTSWLSGFLALDKELASPGNCISHTPQISAQWWSQSFSLKDMNTMIVIVKSMWTELLLTNLHSFIEKASLQSIGKTNKQTNNWCTKWSDFR